MIEIFVIFFVVINTIDCVDNYPKKTLNLVFLLDRNDTVTELAIRNTGKIVSHYSKYDLNPIIYKIEENEISNTGNIVCQQLGSGIAAIFGPQQSIINEIIQSISLTLEIPQFQTVWNPNLATFTKLAQSDKPFNGGINGIFNFNLYPNPYQLSKALATLVRENDWKTYTIIYETDDGLIRLQEVLKVYNPKDPPIMYRKLGPGPDYRSVLKQIRSKNVLQIILDCKTDNIINILLQAKEVKLLEEYHAYLLTSLDARTVDFSALGDIKTNISIINIMNENGLEKAIRNWELETYQPVQLSSKDIKINTALMYDALNLFINSFSQLDHTEELYVKPLNCDPHAISSHGYPLAAFIAKKNMTFGRLLGLPLSGPIAFNKFGQRSSFQLEIMEMKNHKFRVTGMWDSNTPNVINSTITSEDREKEKVQEISGRMFKVVSRIGPPYLMRKPPIEGQPYVGNNRFEGFAMDLIDEICKILNCTYQFEIVPDNNYGSYDPKTKSWNGLIGYLLDRKADLAICDLTTTYERRKAVDFTNPFMTLGISILYAKPNKPPPEILAFTNPLSLDIWLYMATGYIIISLIIYLAARLNPHEWESPHPCDPNPVELENVWNLKNCFWLTLGSILGQGCDILPKGISTRMVTGMWWFFSLIMTACYTANLAAFLTMERMGPTIKSAEDLASQTKIKYGCVRGGATSSFFKDSNVTTYHKMWVSMEGADPSVFEKSNDDGVKRVLSSRGAYAFLMESSTIEYEMARHCELVQVGDWLDTKGYGIAMPTNAPYRTGLNQAILELQEIGKLQELKQRWWEEKNRNSEDCKVVEESGDATAELGLDHVGGVFLVLACGIGVALVIALLEFLWNVRKVAITQRTTLMEAFIREKNFALDFRTRQKAVFPPPLESARKKPSN